MQFLCKNTTHGFIEANETIYYSIYFYILDSHHSIRHLFIQDHNSITFKKFLEIEYTVTMTDNRSFTILALTFLLEIGFGKIRFVPGKGCGTETPIESIKSLDDSTKGHTCIFVEDEESFKAYILDTQYSKKSNSTLI